MYASYNLKPSALFIDEQHADLSGSHGNELKLTESSFLSAKPICKSTSHFLIDELTNGIRVRAVELECARHIVPYLKKVCKSLFEN